MGSKPRALGDILKELVADLDTQTKLGEAAVVAAWQDVSGPQVKQVTEKVWMDRKTLFVKLSSASWRHELHMQRGAWCERLNRELGRNAVDQIVFR